MPLRAEEIQIYYEISMSIGSGLDYRRMLKESLGKYLRKLNLSAGCLLKLCETKEGTFRFEPFYMLPKLQAANRATQIVNSRLSCTFEKEGLAFFRADLPLRVECENGEWAYLLDLPNFGLLVLVKSGESLSEQTVHSLGPLNLKLSNALNACLQKEALAESEDRLEKANEQLNEFDADKLAFIQYISHELNTPLNWIGSLHMIQREELSDENQQCIDFVSQGFARISKLAQLATAYFERASSMARPRQSLVSLSELASSLRLGSRRCLAAKELMLEFEGDWESQLFSDQSGLEEVLFVLLENAANFSLWNQVVRLSCRMDGSEIEFRVADEGVGIEPEDLERIFKPCQIPEHQRSEGGYGFSLPRAKLICAANGWQLTARSEGTGKGALFLLQL